MGSTVTKGMILAAGRGSRLGELGARVPKTLVEIGGEPLLGRILRQFAEAGIMDVMINVHHLADQVQEYVYSHCPSGVKVAFSHESELLDTGGAIKRVEEFFGNSEQFLIHNGDIWSDIPLSEVFSAYSEEFLGLLCVNRRHSSRILLETKSHALAGWEDIRHKQRILCGTEAPSFQASFCGIQVLNRRIFQFMRDLGATFWIFDPLFLGVDSGEIVKLHDVSGYGWHDIGTVEKITALNAELAGSGI